VPAEELARMMRQADVYGSLPAVAHRRSGHRDARRDDRARRRRDCSSSSWSPACSRQTGAAASPAGRGGPQRAPAAAPAPPQRRPRPAPLAGCRGARRRGAAAPRRLRRGRAPRPAAAPRSAARAGGPSPCSTCAMRGPRCSAPRRHQPHVVAARLRRARRRLDGDVLTLAFQSQSDVAKFKKLPAGAARAKTCARRSWPCSASA
jgi:DNA polymerase-3 subunit gamma/tau